MSLALFSQIHCKPCYPDSLQNHFLDLVASLVPHKQSGTTFSHIAYRHSAPRHHVLAQHSSSKARLQRPRTALQHRAALVLPERFCCSSRSRVPGAALLESKGRTSPASWRKSFQGRSFPQTCPPLSTKQSHRMCVCKQTSPFALGCNSDDFLKASHLHFQE